MVSFKKQTGIVFSSFIPSCMCCNATIYLEDESDGHSKSKLSSS